MGFHRRTAPLYFGGLPAGYDYLNDPAANGDAGVAAPADGKKATGPNAGTYLVAFGEDATASNTNRGLSAIGENTDLIDDLLRTSQVVMRVFTSTTVGATTTFVLTGDVYVGGPSDTPATVNNQDTRDRLVHVVDDLDNEMESGSRVQVTSIANGAAANQVGVPASGFFTNPTITVSPAIPALTPFRVYYLTRRSLTDIIQQKPGEFFFEQVRNVHRVDAQIRSLLRTLHAPGFEQNWNQTWTTTIRQLATRGLDGAYRWSTQDSLEADYESDIFPTTFDTGGAGAFILRDGPAPTIYGQGEAMYVDPMQALLRLDAYDVGQPRGTTGLITIGNRKAQSTYTGESNFQPGLATMISTIGRRQVNTVHASDPRTRIIQGATVTLTTVNADPNVGEAYVELPAGQYFWETAFGGQTAINIGYDLIDLQFTQGGFDRHRTYVMVKGGSSAAPTNNRRMRLRCLDGTIPDFAGATFPTFKRWHSVVFAVGDGGGPRHQQQYAYAADESIKLNGLFFGVPTTTNNNNLVTAGVPTFCGNNDQSTAPCLEWGSIIPGLPPQGYTRKGYLAGSGRVVTTGDVHADAGFSSSTGAVQTRIGPYPNSVTSTSLSNVSTQMVCPIDTSRFFLFTGLTTMTVWQVLDVTFTGAPLLLNGMEMTIVFVQPAGGASGGTVKTGTWPASALFESISDKMPAVGLGKMTVWRGIYISSNWRFTKHVY